MLDTSRVLPPRVPRWRITAARVALAVLVVLFLIGLLGLIVPARASSLPANPYAESLEDRALAWCESRWDGPFRLRNARARAFVRELARIVEGQTQPGVFPAAELVLSVSWRESRWRPKVIGPKRGERGLMQVHGRVLRELRPGEDVFDPAVNVRLGISHLRLSYETCGGDLRRTLLHYASGDCSGPSDARRRAAAVRSAISVQRLADQMR